MSKVLNIPNGDLYIYVQDGGTIRLDTGAEQGAVRITGDLIVDGNTTTVQSEDLVVKDNIIVVNNGETGAGITLGEAGLQVDRGTEPDNFWVFNESISWEDAVSETTITGAWWARNFANGSGAIKVATIVSHGDSDNDLNIDFDGGTGAIAVIHPNYTNAVTEDDHLANKKYVDDEIAASLTSVFQKRIQDPAGGGISDSYVEINDFETTGSPSNLEIALDGIVVSTMTPTRFEVAGFRFDGTKIQVIDSNEDLVLSAPGTGVIRIDDTILINSVPGIDDVTTTPPTPSDGVAIYATTEGNGNTGLYFVTAAGTSDELVSRNRALVLSMLF